LLGVRIIVRKQRPEPAKNSVGSFNGNLLRHDTFQQRQIQVVCPFCESRLWGWRLLNNCGQNRVLTEVANGVWGHVKTALVRVALLTTHTKNDVVGS